MIQAVSWQDCDNIDSANKAIVDREKISNELLNRIYGAPGSIVIIVYAKTGLGKTALKNKLRAKLVSSNSEYLLLNASPSLENDNHSSSTKGLYLRSVFEEMRRRLEQTHDLSYQAFFLQSGERRKDNASRLIDLFAKRGHGQKAKRLLAAELMKRVLCVGEYDAASSKPDGLRDSITMQGAYIEHVMGRLKTFIAIENAQNIDEFSLARLEDILNSTRNTHHVVLLEYTLTDSHSVEDALRMKDKWRASQVETIACELEKLDVEYICDAVHLFNNGGLCLEHENSQLAKYYIEHSDGNLFSVFVYFEELKNNNGIVFGSSAAVYESAILSLGNAHQQALIAVAANGGSMAYDALGNVLDKSEVEVASIGSQLESRKLATKTNGALKLSHASIGDAITQTEDVCIQKSLFEIRRSLIKYYEGIAANSKEKFDRQEDDAWIHLITLYSSSNPKKLGDLLARIQKEVVRKISPEQAWSYMSQFIACTKKEIGEQIDNYWTVLRICFACELYQEGFEVLTIMEEKPTLFLSPNVLAYKASFLSALDRHEENIALFESISTEQTLGSKTWVRVALAVLASYRSLGQYDKCEELAANLEQREKNKNSYEEAILLRLSELYMKRKKAIRKVQRSAEIFEGLGLHRQAGKSLINLAYLQAQTGNPERALCSLERAREHLKNEYVGKHMILVNESLALLRMGLCDRRIWELLDEAEESAVVPFDKLGIILNKIAWCCAAENFDKIEYLEACATELIPYEPDKDGVCLVYNNLQIAYSLMKDGAKACKYASKVEELRNLCKPIQALRSGDRLARKYLFKDGWYAGGLAYWTFDLPDPQLTSS